MHDIATAPVLAAPRNDVVLTSSNLPAVSKPGPAVVFERQAQFERLMELRGHEPAPMKTRNWLWNGGASWGFALSGAAAAIGLPLEAAAVVPMIPMVITTGALLIGGLAIGGMFHTIIPSPLSLITRWNHLRERDLKFLGNIKEAPQVEQAVVGILAEGWLKRIDKQRVYGEEAYAILEDIIAHKKTLPESVIARAQAMLNLHAATVDYRDGSRHKSLTDEQVRSIISAFEALDPQDRPSCGAELMKRYFKGEVARHRIQSHEHARRLYRTLRDGVNQAPAATS